LPNQTRSGIGVIRTSIFTLLGVIAGPFSYITQRRTESSDRSRAALTFDVVTGIVDEMSFKAHGHTRRLGVAAAR
jgi:hypothetical protein